MTPIIKPIQSIFVLVIIAALSGCSLGQAATPTPTQVDVNSVMTAAAATAFVQLTQIAGQASPTSLPSQTPTNPPATNTPDPLSATATLEPALQLLTPTEAANGLPAQNTPAVVNTPDVNAVPSLTAFPGPTIVVGGGVVPTAGPTCFNAKFLEDMTIPDGTLINAGEKFYKVWRIQNTGLCKWDQGFGLVFWAGESMQGSAIYFSNNDQAVGPGGTVDLGIEMRAPTASGEYIGHWTMITDQGQTFGNDLLVVIKVP